MTSSLGDPEEAQLPRNDIEFIKPRLRLFLSVDLIGSTSFKQSKANRKFDDVAQPWFEPIIQFYHEFEKRFARELNRFRELGLPHEPKPELWKVIGDELVYLCEINEVEEVLCLLQVWRVTLIEYRQVLKHTHPELDVKSAAWLAGFPFQNAEVALSTPGQFKIDTETSEDPKLSNFLQLKEHYEGALPMLLDFVGPSIDTGFRICKFATERKFVLSADLAYIVCSLSDWWRSKTGDWQRNNVESPYATLELQIRYDGRMPLKGVLQNQGYPVVWLDQFIGAPDSLEFKHDKIDKIEDEILNRPGSARSFEQEASSIRTLLETFLDGKTEFPSAPYIANGNKAKQHPTEKFYSVPEDHTDKVMQMRAYFSGQVDKIKLEEDNLGDADDGSGEALDIPEAVEKIYKGNIEPE